MIPLNRYRRALTLVELMVVFVIVGVLAALVFPAIQSAREAGRNTQCVNNLKQLALGALTFESGSRRVPGGTAFRAPFDPYNTFPSRPRVFHGQGWIVEVLPFIEQGPLFDQFAQFRQVSLKAPYSELPAEQLSLVANQPSALTCPSDPSGRELISTQYQWEGILVAPTNYRGVMGSNQMVSGSNTFPIEFPTQQVCNDGRAPCNGLIWRTSAHYSVKLEHVLDGLSNTMMVGEDLPSHNWHSMWSYSNGDASSTYATLNHSLKKPDPRAWWDMRGFRSLHPGGANFAYADGAVRFVHEDVDSRLYRAMSTIAEQDGFLEK